MKKLIVLMIVLFPVTAWAQSYKEKSPGELCTNLYRGAFITLEMMDRVNFVGLRAMDEKRFEDVKNSQKLEGEARKRLAEEGAIYSAFCKK